MSWTPKASGSHHPVVSVYGSAFTPQDAPDYRDAVRLGRMLGRAGASVACGGYGGIMEAVARGVSETGGRAIGYTVRGWSARSANPYLTEQRPCHDLYERLRHLIEDGDALVALGGGTGTLVEVAMAWNQLYLKVLSPRPLIVVGSRWRRAVDALAELLEIGDMHRELLTCSASVDEAMDVLVQRRIVAHEQAG